MGFSHLNLRQQVNIKEEDNDQNPGGENQYKRLTFKMGRNKISQTIGDAKYSAYKAF